jgi:hypothetical protein
MGRTTRTPPKNRKPPPQAKKTRREVLSDEEVDVPPAKSRKPPPVSKKMSRDVLSEDEAEAVQVRASRRDKSNLGKKGKCGDEYDDIRKVLKKSGNAKCYSSGSDELSSDDDEKITPKKTASKKKNTVFITPDSPCSDDGMKKKKSKRFDLNNIRVHKLNFSSNASNDSDDSVDLSVPNMMDNNADDQHPRRQVASLPTARNDTGFTSTATAVGNGSLNTNSTLATFGIRPAVSTLTGVIQQASARTSELRAVIIRGIDGNSDILLRCEPVGVNHTVSWSEKIFSDAVRTKEAWTTSLNVCSELFPWFERNVQQNNPKGFPIRLFYIPAANIVTVPRLVALCMYICDRINSTPGNNTVLSVNENRLLWLDENAVWSDVVGVSKACQMVVNARGITFPGFYELHHHFIHTFFRPTSFTLELVNYFHAPMSTLNTEDQALNEETNNEDNGLH